MTQMGIVLIVEDDPDLGNFLRTAVQRRSDRSVRLADNGEKALQILADEAVDVLITDIQNAGNDGPGNGCRDSQDPARAADHHDDGTCHRGLRGGSTPTPGG